ncbi:hypothetical protein MRX96_054871, partial [Rhipicephalus microplus]
PRIVLDNGNMVFQVPSAKNISFRTSSGRGGIFLNGRDVAEVLAKVSEAARTIEPIAANTQLQTLTETVETVTTLRSQMSQLSTKCQQLQTKVRRLEANLTRVVRVPINRLVTAIRRLRTGLNQNSCASNPCSHGGTCIGRFNAFTCICPPSWEGLRCEVDVDECSHWAGSDLGCQNNARCINMPGSYRCECAQGFYGARCTESQDACTTTSSHSLCDHGTCVSLPRTNNPPYMCLCEQGWTKGLWPAVLLRGCRRVQYGSPFLLEKPARSLHQLPGRLSMCTVPEWLFRRWLHLLRYRRVSLQQWWLFPESPRRLLQHSRLPLLRSLSSRIRW